MILVCDICGVRRVVGIGECGESWHYFSWYWRCRFAVLWVGLLVTIKKESPLNVLTRSWASFIFCD